MTAATSAPSFDIKESFHDVVFRDDPDEWWRYLQNSGPEFVCQCWNPDFLRDAVLRTCPPEDGKLLHYSTSLLMALHRECVNEHSVQGLPVDDRSVRWEGLLFAAVHTSHSQRPRTKDWLSQLVLYDLAIALFEYPFDNGGDSPEDLEENNRLLRLHLLVHSSESRLELGALARHTADFLSRVVRNPCADVWDVYPRYCEQLMRQFANRLLHRHPFVICLGGRPTQTRKYLLQLGDRFRQRDSLSRLLRAWLMGASAFCLDFLVQQDMHASISDCFQLFCPLFFRRRLNRLFQYAMHHRSWSTAQLLFESTSFLWSPDCLDSRFIYTMYTFAELDSFLHRSIFPPFVLFYIQILGGDSKKKMRQRAFPLLLSFLTHYLPLWQRPVSLSPSAPSSKHKAVMFMCVGVNQPTPIHLSINHSADFPTKHEEKKSTNKEQQDKNHDGDRIVDLF